MEKLQKYWNEEGGAKQLLKVAIPMIISTIAWTIQHFIDRVFLTWYSPESIAAAMPAGMLQFLMVCLFLGIVGYVNVFIAQYHGAKEYDKFGAILWQGIYIAIFGSILMLAISPFSENIFQFVGHGPNIMKNEIVYFRILAITSFPMIFSSAISGFYSGRGKTEIIMYINLGATLVNIILDYILIFGKFGFPEMGIKGAAIATAFSYSFAMIVYIFLIFTSKNNKIYHTISDYKFDFPLFKQLLKFGFPNGMQFFLDIAGFSIFILIVGRLGTAELISSNIALNINNLVFMPLLGISMSVSILVGQFLGDDKPELAEKVSNRGIHLSYLYIIPFITLFWFFPDVFIGLFNIDKNSAEFSNVYEMLVVILRFMAIYSLFDVVNQVYAGSLKGAGDTAYIMKIIGINSLLIMIIPIYIGLNIFKLHLFYGWSFITAYIIILGICFVLRFRSGKWKSMRVVNKQNRFLTDFPEVPTLEI